MLADSKREAFAKRVKNGSSNVTIDDGRALLARCGARHGWFPSWRGVEEQQLLHLKSRLRQFLMSNQD